MDYVTLHTPETILFFKNNNIKLNEVQLKNAIQFSANAAIALV